MPEPAVDEPAAWLVAHLDFIPRPGRVLDVASGSGRNARFLARNGWRVHAVDRDASRLLVAGGEGVTTDCVDLESGPVSFGHQCYQAVIVFNYLHRPLVPAIVDAVAPGGVLIYETFTTPQARRGRPTNPDYLLRPGELVTLVAPLRIVRAREGDFDGKSVASVVAIR